MDGYDVKKYLNIPLMVSRLRAEKKEIHASLYEANLAVHTYYDGTGITVSSPKIETLVMNLMSCEELIDKRIERMELRYRLFQHKDLTYQQYKRLSTGEKNKIKDDLFEVETYVAYHCGYLPPDQELELTDNQQADIEMLAEYFKVL